MTKKQPEETKLLMLPAKLVNRIKEATDKKGMSLTSWACEVFEDALEAEKLGASLKDTLDTYKMREIHRGAGTLIVPRSSLSYVVENCKSGERKDLTDKWFEAGHWYGSYISSKLKLTDTFKMLEKDLKTSWNLDEIELKGGDEPIIRFTSFVMSNEITELLLSYLSGIMESLGFREVEHDNLRGMATVKYAKIPKG
jgi:hypothetical protein